MSSSAHGGTSDPIAIIGTGCRTPGATTASEWLYEVAWTEKARAFPAQSSDPVPAGHGGRWLIFADSHGVAQAVRVLLEARGERCVLLLRTQDVRDFLGEAFGPHQPPWKGILHLWSLDAAPMAETTPATLADAREAGCISVLHIVQGLEEAGRRDAPRLWLVTRNTQAVGAPVGELSIAQAPLWGLGKTIDLEHPELRCTRIDLGPEGDADDALFQELWLNDREREIAFRAGRRYVPRLRHLALEPGAAPVADAESPVRPDATYLITGGFGSLGLAVAKRLAGQGARHLVLMGRGGPSSPVAKETLETLRNDGGQVAVAHGDVARRADVVRILDGIRQHMPPLRGIVHAAGVLDDGTLLQQDRERFARVMTPKVDGAWVLHSLTADAPLDFFVLFSSGASVLGSPGQGNDVAANAFLDTLAHHRRAQGRPAVTINWGPWGEVGSAAQADRSANLAGRGLLPMAPAEALELFDHIMRHRPTQVTAARVDWARVGRVNAPPLLRELVGDTLAPTRGSTSTSP